jgi:hypothetical protein
MQIRFGEDLVVLVRSQRYERLRGGDHSDHIPMTLDREQMIPIDVPVPQLMMNSSDGRDIKNYYQLVRGRDERRIHLVVVSRKLGQGGHLMTHCKLNDVLVKLFHLLRGEPSGSQPMFQEVINLKCKVVSASLEVSDH